MPLTLELRKEISTFQKKLSRDYNIITDEGKVCTPKKIILGIIKRDGKVVLKYVSGETTTNMVDFIVTNVPHDSTFYLD